MSRGSVICHFPKGKNDNDDTCIPVIEMHKMTTNDKNDTLGRSEQITVGNQFWINDPPTLAVNF